MKINEKCERCEGRDKSKKEFGKIVLFLLDVLVYMFLFFGNLAIFGFFMILMYKTSLESTILYLVILALNTSIFAGLYWNKFYKMEMEDKE